MKVIPVIDILNGQTVHAIRGKRAQYKPLQSILTQSTNPLDVAKTFKALGFSQLYVADLDAIIDCSSDFGILKQIVDETGLDLMVDAGVTSLQRADVLIQSGISKLIIGTETMQSKEFVTEALKAFGNSRVILSLDLKAGKVLVGPNYTGPTEPLQLLRELVAMGLSQVIVLDLARVGSGEGVDLEFLKQVKAIGLNVFVGGGVRGIEDLVALKALGLSGALIATSLHTGKIDVADLQREGLL